ncbi:MAG: hypothetical protein AB7E13_07045 [Arcobacteraceae bacterium]
MTAKDRDKNTIKTTLRANIIKLIFEPFSSKRAMWGNKNPFVTGLQNFSHNKNKANKKINTKNPFITLHSE